MAYMHPVGYSSMRTSRFAVAFLWHRSIILLLVKFQMATTLAYHFKTLKGADTKKIAENLIKNECTELAIGWNKITEENMAAIGDALKNNRVKIKYTPISDIHFDRAILYLCITNRLVMTLILNKKNQVPRK